MVKYKITHSAAGDIDGIKQHTIEQWGENKADEYIADIATAIEMLADNPLIGLHKKEIRKSVKIYGFPHDRHVVYYTIKRHYIVVIGVLGGEMLPKPHLRGRSTTA